jgi:signal transduction histidine kinase
MGAFILEHMEEILVEWESFARSISPAGATMDSLALRNHAQPMLEAIAKDLETSQSDVQQALKSKGLGPTSEGVVTAAAAHGVLRHAVGFDLRQLVAEFRALRASVLRLWVGRKKPRFPTKAFHIIRFNEALDQALAESIATYSDELARSRKSFLTGLGDDLLHPLAAMSVALQNFSASGGDANRAQAFAVGNRSVSSMSGMIRDMSEYTRIRLEEGISLAPCEANLEIACQIALNEVGVVYPHTAFRFECGGDLDGVFDKQRIQQLAANLLSNAVQRGKRGAPISLIVRGVEDALTLSVTYTRAGVPVTAEPSVQAPLEPPHARAAANSSLAVFVAREIALAHGGTMHAASAGPATTFTVVLPRVAVAGTLVGAFRAGPLEGEIATRRVIH